MDAGLGSVELWPAGRVQRASSRSLALDGSAMGRDGFQEERGLGRETASAYLKAAGITNARLVICAEALQRQ